MVGAAGFCLLLSYICDFSLLNFTFPWNIFKIWPPSQEEGKFALCHSESFSSTLGLIAFKLCSTAFVVFIFGFIVICSYID